jgi:hypothetical protein
MPDEPLDQTPYIDPYHAAAIMRVISIWAEFEYEIDQSIWALARLEPEQGACITSQLPGAMARMNALISLAKIENIPAKHINALNGVVERLNGPREMRNRLVHGPWFSGWESKQHYRLDVSTNKRRLEYAYTVVTEDDLNKMLREFQALQARFRKAHHEMMQDFYKLP